MRLTLTVITAVAVVYGTAACQVPTLTTVTPVVIPPITTPGPVSITAIGSGFVPGQSLVYANGVPMPTTVTDPNTLTFQLANSLPQASVVGGVTIAVVNPSGAESHFGTLHIGSVTGVIGSNVGVIGFRPLGYSPGQSIRLHLEGLYPGVPLTLLADTGTPLPIAYFPFTAALLMGVTPGSPGFFSVVDGLGLFGVPDPNAVTQPLPSGALPLGVYTSPPFTTPSPLAGVSMNLQAVSPDVASPVGWRVTWTRFPFTL